MQTTAPNLRRVKEFAREAGVTVRALHLYDRLDLLKPAALTASGYRLYGAAELERLEQILALRFVGFNLEQIKELLRETRRPLAAALIVQRELIARQKRRLELALVAIDEAQSTLSGPESVDVWAALRNVIEAFNMQNDFEWTKKYYSEEALDQLEEQRRKMPEQEIRQAERDWAALLTEVEEAAARGLDPSSEAAAALAARWRALLARFTQGSAEVARGLDRLWSGDPHADDRVDGAAEADQRLLRGAAFWIRIKAHLGLVSLPKSCGKDDVSAV